MPSYSPIPQRAGERTLEALQRRAVHMQVAYAIVHGILREEDIPEEVRPYIEGALEFCGYGSQEA
jgi:hypothetical protein